MLIRVPYTINPQEANLAGVWSIVLSGRTPNIGVQIQSHLALLYFFPLRAFREVTPNFQVSDHIYKVAVS